MSIFQVFGVGTGVSSILMMLSPVAAKQGVIPLIVTRVLIGLFEVISITVAGFLE